MITKTLESLRRNWSANPRVRWLLGVIVLILMVEGALRWYEWIGRSFQELGSLQLKITQLRNQTRDISLLQGTLNTASEVEVQAKTRLLASRSEAAAQAILQDWVAGVAAKVGSANHSSTVGAARPAGQTGRPQPGAETSPRGEALFEVPVSITATMTPESVIAWLRAIEGGPWMIRTQSLSIRTADRRFEIGLLVPITMKAPDQP
jgi:hypothetical protein